MAQAETNTLIMTYSLCKRIKKEIGGKAESETLDNLLSVLKVQLATAGVNVEEINK